MRRISYLLLFSSFFLILFILLSPPPAIQKPSFLLPKPQLSQNIQPAETDTRILGVRTKSVGCRASGPFPDADCTPGDVFTAVTEGEICAPGYSAKVRDVSQSTKNQVYESYGIFSHFTGEYEVDHLISLELGGSNDISNLWPEAADPRPGFHEKDRVENYLHREICSGRISLKEAQKIISNDWTSVKIND